MSEIAIYSNRKFYDNKEAIIDINNNSNEFVAWKLIDKIIAFEKELNEDESFEKFVHIFEDKEAMNKYIDDYHIKH